MTSAPVLPSPTWFAGCGNMGQAIVAGWRGAGLDLSNAVAIRPSGTPVEGLRTVVSYGEAGPPPKLVILAFKPQKLAEAAAQLRPWVTSKTIIVSLLAGADCKTLREHFPKAQAIVRAMPNLGVAVRRGVVALVGEDVPDEIQVQMAGLFATLGFAPWMVDEARFSAVGAVAGAGPAYVARFIAALTKAGEGRGLSPEMAATVALETVLGTSWMAAASSESMEAIASRVASPKGTTEAGLAVLDHDRVLDELVALAIDAAGRRGAELAAEARGTSLAAEAPLA
jgi:pyrroline-5-carboxylate reductase